MRVRQHQEHRGGVIKGSAACAQLQHHTLALLTQLAAAYTRHGRHPVAVRSTRAHHVAPHETRLVTRQRLHDRLALVSLTHKGWRGGEGVGGQAWGEDSPSGGGGSTSSTSSASSSMRSTGPASVMFLEFRRSSTPSKERLWDICSTRRTCNQASRRQPFCEQSLQSPLYPCVGPRTVQKLRDSVAQICLNRRCTRNDAAHPKPDHSVSSGWHG